MTEFKSVPVEPTDDMLDAARGLIMAMSFNAPNSQMPLGMVAESGFYGELWGHILTDEERLVTHLTKAHRADLIYRAMLSASPAQELSPAEAKLKQAIEALRVIACYEDIGECPRETPEAKSSLGDLISVKIARQALAALEGE